MSGGEIQRTSEDMPPSTQLPRFWHFWWMFWMQPILLHQRLRACGIDYPNVSAIRLWLVDDTHRPVRRQYVRRMAAMVVVGSPLLGFGLTASLNTLGLPVDYQSVAFGVAIGVAFGVVGSFLVGVVYGVAIGVVVGVAIGVTGGPLIGGVYSVAAGAATGAVGGVAYGIAYGVAIGAVGTVATGIAFGVAAGVAAGAAVIRLPILPFEVLGVLFARPLGKLFRLTPLRLAPVLWHDLSYVPLPGLRRLLLEAAESDRALLREALAGCQRSPGQRRIGEGVLATLKARDWKRQIQSGNLIHAAELKSEWLAGANEDDSRLLSLKDASSELRAASMSVVARHRLQHVERAHETLHSLRNRLLVDRSQEAPEFLLALEAAEVVATNMAHEARELMQGQLPNPFRAGEPLTPETSQEMFRGREDLVRQIELLLNDEKQAAAVSVIAPRRCGKSSLLRMLPVKLPDALCVFFDLQDNPIGAPLDLFPALERRLREQTRPQQRESLPRLRDSSLEAARDWLEALEQRPGRDRILFCLDEFERLEEVVGEKPETKQQLIQLMGLLRATIQHRRRVRILVSGNSTFEELGPLWNDSFISARELRLGPLERDVAIDLIRQPIPVSEGFPADAVPQAVAEAIVDRTGGQPYLTQLYGFWLVEELNKTKRKQAELQDVETVDQIVFEQAAPFFSDSLNPRGATFAVKPVIEQIVAGHKPELTGNQTRFLMRRGLINADGTLAFPILARWLNEYAE